MATALLGRADVFGSVRCGMAPWCSMQLPALSSTGNANDSSMSAPGSSERPPAFVLCGMTPSLWWPGITHIQEDSISASSNVTHAETSGATRWLLLSV